MPLLDADIALQPASGGKGSRPLIVALVLAVVIAGLAIGIFVFAPKQATEVVREVVQAAQSLMKKDPPPADAANEEDKPAISSQRKPRDAGSTAANPAASTVRAETSAAMPTVRSGAVKRQLLLTPDLPAGTARASVRELLGEPDLIVSKLEHGHVVEHFVYVNHSLNAATSVLLVDGLVSSVDAGMPSVRISKTAVKTPRKAVP